MTTIFLISGFRLDHTAATLPEFKDFIAKLEAKKYNVVPVDISYKNKTHSQFVEELIKDYTGRKTDKNIIVGNSFGAAVALIAAELFQPDELYLCSMSPFFKETLKDPRYLAYTVKKFGLKRARDLRRYSFMRLAEKANKAGIKVTFLYGEKETHPELVAFNKQAQPAFANSTISEVKNAPHGLKDPHYYNAVVERL